MGWHVDGRVLACVGTHTHVPTSDARVLPGGTAYVTDVGMTGPRGGVIGVKREQALERFLTLTQVRFETSDEDPWLNAVVIEGDAGGRAISIEQVLAAGGRVAPAEPARAREQRDVAQRHERDRKRLARPRRRSSGPGNSSWVRIARRRECTRQRVHPPGERERAERDQPEQVLGREDLAQRGEGRTAASAARTRSRGPASGSRRGCSGRRDHGEHQHERPAAVSALAGGVLQPVRAMALHAVRLPGAERVEQHGPGGGQALDLDRALEVVVDRLACPGRRQRPAPPAPAAPRAATSADTDASVVRRSWRAASQARATVPPPRSGSPSSSPRGPAPPSPSAGAASSSSTRRGEHQGHRGEVEVGAHAARRSSSGIDAAASSARARGRRPSARPARRRAAPRRPPAAASSRRRPRGRRPRRSPAGRAARSPAPPAAGTRRTRRGTAARRPSTGAANSR